MGMGKVLQFKKPSPESRSMIQTIGMTEGQSQANLEEAIAVLDAAERDLGLRRDRGERPTVESIASRLNQAAGR